MIFVYHTLEGLYIITVEKQTLVNMFIVHLFYISMKRHMNLKRNGLEKTSVEEVYEGYNIKYEMLRN